VTGGALSTHDGKWHPSRPNFYLPVRALSKIYRGKFRDLMKKNGLFHLIPPEVWKIDWNVNIQPVGGAEAIIKYLSFYVFKVAISDHRIVNVENRKVTFSYKKSGSVRTRHLILDVMEFIRRFLQHVLPAGFMKVRYYGFMSPNSSASIDRIRGLIELSYEFEVTTPGFKTEKPEPFCCPSCGGELKYLYSILPFQLVPNPKKEGKMISKIC